MAAAKQTTTVEMEAGNPKKAVPAKKSSAKMMIAVGAVLGVVAIAVAVVLIVVLRKDSVSVPETLPLIGHYMTDWGTAITVTSTTWYSMSSYGDSASAIDSYGANYVIMQNPADDAYNPSKWSKVEWHGEGAAGFSYCTTVYDATTKEEALNRDTDDIYDENDASGGCGASGFAHTVASPYNMPNRGTFLDNWGSYITITDDTWYSGKDYSTIDIYGSNVAVVLTSPNAYNPNTYSKLRFHTVGSGFGYCTTAYGLEDLTTAFNAAEVYNASDATSGCGASGFGHTVASPYSIPIAGSWSDNWGTAISVTNSVWTSGGSAHHIEAYSNSWLLIKTPADAYYPNTWSRIDFHPATAGGSVANGFGYCTTVYNATTAAEALTTAGTYNASDASGGCGASGFSHSVASPA